MVSRCDRSFRTCAAVDPVAWAMSSLDTVDRPGPTSSRYWRYDGSRATVARGMGWFIPADASPVDAAGTAMQVSEEGVESRAQPVARVRRSRGSAIARSRSAALRTLPAVPGVWESTRFPITFSVMSAIACVPSASRSPAFKIHG